MQITENVSGTPTTLEFVWCGNQRCETRNGTGFGTVVNQFFPMGEVIGGTNYFYTKDKVLTVRAGITKNHKPFAMPIELIGFHYEKY